MKKFWVVAVLVFFLDQISKYFILNRFDVGEGLDLGVLSINHIKNTGVSFGMFQGYPDLMIFIIIAVIFFILYSYKDLAVSDKAVYALGGIIGGAFGNLMDRLLIGAVTDFIDFGWWPAFNIADTAICIGAFILFLEMKN